MLKLRKNENREKCNILNKMMSGCYSAYRYIPFNNFLIKDEKIVLEEYNGNTNKVKSYQYYDLADIVYAINSSIKPTETISGYIDWIDLNGKIHKTSVEELVSIIVGKHIITRTYLLGTDRFGRDMLSQLIIGMRVSIAVGMISVLISLIIGLLLGSLSGFFRGWTDEIIIWFINVVWSIPTLLLVIAITFALGKGFWQVFIAVGLTMWVEIARVVRGQIISIREKEYIEAGKALGYSNFRLITRHILPNIMGIVIVISAANFAAAILIEAGLSFLGLGVQPPVPSWGTMIKENYPYIILDKAYLAILPGIAIMIMVLAFMLVGNGLRDALDIKTVKR